MVSFMFSITSCTASLNSTHNTFPISGGKVWEANLRKNLTIERLKTGLKSLLFFISPFSQTVSHKKFVITSVSTLPNQVKCFGDKKKKSLMLRDKDTF